MKLNKKKIAEHSRDAFYCEDCDILIVASNPKTAQSTYFWHRIVCQ